MEKCCTGIWPIPLTVKELYYNNFGILFMNFKFACYALSTK